MASVTIQPVGDDDFPVIALLQAHGFGPSPVSKLMFPSQSPEEQAKHGEGMLRNASKDPQAIFSKAVKDEKIVGFSQWYYYVEEPLKKDAPSDREDGKDFPPEIWGPGSNADLCETFFGGMKRARRDNMGGRNCAGQYIFNLHHQK
jgi:hypothetical protein